MSQFINPHEQQSKARQMRLANTRLQQQNTDQDKKAKQDEQDWFWTMLMYNHWLADLFTRLSHIDYLLQQAINQIDTRMDELGALTLDLPEGARTHIQAEQILLLQERAELEALQNTLAPMQAARNNPAQIPDIDDLADFERALNQAEQRLADFSIEQIQQRLPKPSPNHSQLKMAVNAPPLCNHFDAANRCNNKPPQALAELDLAAFKPI